MKTKVASFVLMTVIAGSAAGQSVGDPELLAKQQKNAEVAAGLIDQEPLYQEGVLAGARIKREREAQEARDSANRALRAADAAVARAESNLRAAENKADRNLRTIEAEMAVRRTIAIEAIARRR